MVCTVWLRVCGLGLCFFVRGSVVVKGNSVSRIKSQLDFEDLTAVVLRNSFVGTKKT